MAGRVHPAVDHRVCTWISDGQILAKLPVVVSMLFDPGPWLDTVRRDVTEVLLVEHVGDAIVGCGFEAGVDPQGRQAECRALAIHLLDNCFLETCGRTIRLGHIRDSPA